MRAESLWQPSEQHLSWGRWPKARHLVTAPQASDLTLPEAPEGKTLLPYGLGRSYGDSCLNDGGALLVTSRLDHFLDFDAEAGILRCEAGVTLASILRISVPRGWFLPVTPGTKFVTVGGAIANDVHGKNHHAAGTFGRHVRRLCLLRSDGRRLVCSPEENSELFAATIGGLGLTGLIVWAELKLKAVAGPYMSVVTQRFRNVDEFLALAPAANAQYPYTVAWIDGLSTGRALGRGLLFAGDHAEIPGSAGLEQRRRFSVPHAVPSLLAAAPLVRAFNTLYYRRPVRAEAFVHYEPFFYPLDSLHHWNRLYGRRGFLQYQCVVPPAALAELLGRIARAKTGSFLSVLKLFGDRPSPGLLSFPRPGVTLAMDFPNRGAATLKLLAELDAVVVAAAGAVYPAKDARLGPAAFERFFPRHSEFRPNVDPAFSSTFWRRATGLEPTYE